MTLVDMKLAGLRDNDSHARLYVLAVASDAGVLAAKP